MNNISEDTVPVRHRSRGIAWANQAKIVFTEKESRRFWSFVDRKSNPNGCWEWTGFRDVNGYGVFGFRRGSHRAHRLSFLLHVGPIGENLFVCHTCDNPCCINPGHMWLGTPHENTTDMIRKDRDNFGRSGEAHHAAKLNRLQVEEIKKRHSVDGVMQKDLAEEYGIGRMQVSRIVRGLRWK